jgi:hypothetical protein
MIKMTKPNYYVKNVNLDHCQNPNLVRKIINKVHKEHNKDLKPKARSNHSSLAVLEPQAPEAQSPTMMRKLTAAFRGGEPTGDAIVDVSIHSSARIFDNNEESSPNSPYKDADDTSSFKSQHEIINPDLSPLIGVSQRTFGN